jgi:hypothetical protein
MGFYYYRRYRFSHVVKNKWEALAIAKDAEQKGVLNSSFDAEWVKVDDDSGGWAKGLKKQLLGK